MNKPSAIFWRKYNALKDDMTESPLVHGSDAECVYRASLVLWQAEAVMNEALEAKKV